MAELLLAVLIPVGVCFYLFMIGFSYQRVLHWSKKHCRQCSSSSSCDSDHPFVSGWIAVIWPVGLFFITGTALGDPDRLKRKNEALQLRISELEKEVGIHG